MKLMPKGSPSAMYVTPVSTKAGKESRVILTVLREAVEALLALLQAQEGLDVYTTATLIELQQLFNQLQSEMSAIEIGLKAATRKAVEI